MITCLLGTAAGHAEKEPVRDKQAELQLFPSYHQHSSASNQSTQLDCGPASTSKHANVLVRLLRNVLRITTWRHRGRERARDRLGRSLSRKHNRRRPNSVLHTRIGSYTDTIHPRPSSGSHTLEHGRGSASLRARERLAQRSKRRRQGETCNTEYLVCSSDETD